MSRFPDQPPPHPTVAPMVYVAEKAVWEYKQVARDASQDNMPSEEELNQFGKDGWELVSIQKNSGRLYLYFKRMKA
jgi:hypothetical protein